jgi:murein DD-endopeptidase MepM/ murein hydrolase activator NlpD
MANSKVAATHGPKILRSDIDVYPMSQSFEDLLKQHQGDFAPVVPIDWHSANVAVLDFTQQNAALHHVNLADTAVFDAFVSATLQAAKAVVGVGGYNEHRSIYRRSQHFQQSTEPRCIHLGIDIWAKAGTPVYAPASGVVHSFQFNDNFGDYGPTIILEHQLAERTYYTLYGHLSLASLEGKQERQPIEKGQQIATFGDYPINGDWPPHLHFQVMTTMLGLKGDFPGVCSIAEREYYLNICPNANLILQIPQL